MDFTTNEQLIWDRLLESFYNLSWHETSRDNSLT